MISLSWPPSFFRKQTNKTKTTNQNKREKRTRETHTHTHTIRSHNIQEKDPISSKKKYPIKEMLIKSVQKYHWVCSALAIYCWAWSPPLSVANILHWRKLTFSLPASISDSFSVRDGNLCPLPFSMLELRLVWTCAGSVCVITVSESSPILLCLEGVVSVKSSIPFFSQPSRLLFCRVPCTLRGGSEEDTSLRIECPESLSLYRLLRCGSLS